MNERQHHRDDPIVSAFCESDYSRPIVASIFTPYQLLFFERLRAHLPAGPLLVLDSRPERFRTGRPPLLGDATIVPLALTGQVNSAHQAGLIREGLTAIDRFAGGDGFAFVCGSYQWPINAAILHHQHRNPRFAPFLIEEGLSTYLDIVPSPRERWRNLAREAVARLRRFPPRARVVGHPLGHDLPGLRGIIVGIAPLDTGSRRPYLTLPTAQGGQVRFTPDGAILIGQPYLRELGAARLGQLAGAMHTDLRSRGFERIAFKPHHFQPEEERALYRDAGFELIDPPLAVEEMIAASPFRTVVSFNSTALLTVKSLFGNGVHAIAYDPTRIVPRHESRDPAEVEQLFRAAGVEITSLDQGGKGA